MTTETMKIYVYAEHCNRRGVVLSPESYIDDGKLSDDIRLWAEGTREDLIADARWHLATKHNEPRDRFRHGCARAILRHLGEKDGAE